MFVDTTMVGPSDASLDVVVVLPQEAVTITPPASAAKIFFMSGSE